MALLQLDAIVEPKEERNRMVRILNYKRNEEGDFTLYTIELRVGDYSWTVEKRYSQFYEFDRERFQYFSTKSFLPPKKVLGNQEPAFLEQRRSELEQYLRTLLELELWLNKKRQSYALPRKLARFLDFHKYEVHGIVEDLAERLSKRGESWLHQSTSKPKYFEFSPVELHAITERLKLPEPTCDGANSSSDIGNFLDFLHRLPHLKIRGVKGCLGTSNIPVNQLEFSLNQCKNLKSLWITDCDVTKIRGLDNCKLTVKSLVVHYSLNRFSDLLAASDLVDPSSSDIVSCLCDNSPWINAQEADFSFNQILEIDSFITLLEKVEKLDLSGNRLRSIGEELQHLTKLTELNLSNNGLERLDSWHSKLGNVKRLLLAGNSIRSLGGLAKLYSLEYLDVKDNAIMQSSDVWPIGNLPCLERVELSGNPIESSVEYRTRVLEAFGERAAEVYLDGEQGSQRELDTVGVRQAIRKAKEEKERLLENTRKQISEKLKFLENELPNMTESLPGEDLMDRKTRVTAETNPISTGDRRSSSST